MLEFLSHNCKEKASFFLIVFFNLLIVCQKLLIQRYNSCLLCFAMTRFAYSCFFSLRFCWFTCSYLVIF
ncbi:hypothetical protein X973_13580 [Piscirickettsia salmonis]|nr:hypothetical protein X973_13580 [Piscirickettsia salmonis]WGZ72680.1 hypothetical protein E3220_14555 [Piscirickettsia salmonis EM-90]